MIRSGNLKSLNQLINTTMMGSGNKAKVGEVGSGCARKAILKHNLPFPFRACGESVLEDTAQIAASVFGQSSRLSFMYPSCTLILVMLTKEVNGASRANSQHVVIVTDEHRAELVQLASQAISRPCVIY